MSREQTGDPPSPVGGAQVFRNESSEAVGPLTVMWRGSGDRHSHYDKLQDGNPGHFLLKDGTLCAASQGSAYITEVG